METLSGIVHGNTIELSGTPKIADGAQVIVTIQPASETPDYRGNLPGRPPEWQAGGQVSVAGYLAGVWTDEDDRILAEIEQERQSAWYREVGQ